MDAGGVSQSGIAGAVWTNPTRTVTTDPATDAGAATLVWAHASRALTADPFTDAGGGATVWTHAARVLTVGGGAIVGATLQPIGSTGSVSLTAVASTNAVNFTGPAAGALLNMGLILGTSLGTGTASYEIDVVIDGTTFVLPMCVGSQNWNGNGIAICSFISGAGAATPSQCLWSLPIQFTSTLRVSLNVTASTLSAGAATLSVLWGHS